MSEPRTKVEVRRELQYAERMHFRHCRFYKRIRAGLATVSLLAGSAAIVPAIQAIPSGVITAAVVVTVLTIFDVVGNFAEKSVKHGVWRRQAALLIAESEPMDVVQLDAALHRLIAEAGDDELESLRAVCWNDVLDSAGRQDAMRPEKKLEKMMRALA